MLRREVLNLGVLTHRYYWGDGYSVNRLGSGYYPWYYSGDEWFAAAVAVFVSLSWRFPFNLRE
jgi:hypothetical protein